MSTAGCCPGPPEMPLPAAYFSLREAGCEGSCAGGARADLGQCCSGRQGPAGSSSCSCCPLCPALLGVLRAGERCQSSSRHLLSSPWARPAPAPCSEARCDGHVPAAGKQPCPGLVPVPAAGCVCALALAAFLARCEPLCPLCRWLLHLGAKLCRALRCEHGWQ